MADEIRIRAALSWAKSGRSGGNDSGELSVTMAGSKGLSTQQSVTNVEEPLLLGEVSAANAHYWILNQDATNSVDLKPASGGTVTTRIGPGRVAMGQFGPSVAAPYVQSSAGTVEILIELASA